MELQSLRASSGVSFHLIRLRHNRKQRLRLGDLGHFRRRRKPFEGGREDGVRVGESAGRLIVLGERERRLQMRTACALLLRYGDRRPECFLGVSVIGRVALEQNFAAQAMQEGERATMFDLVREAESFVNASQRAVRSQRFRLELRQQSGIEPQVDPNALIDESRQNPSNLGRASYRVIDPTPRPTRMQSGLVEKLHHRLFSRDELQSLGRPQRRHGIATPDFQIRLPEERIDNRPDVTELGRAPGCRSINSRARSTSPNCHMVAARNDDA